MSWLDKIVNYGTPKADLSDGFHQPPDDTGSDLSDGFHQPPDDTGSDLSDGNIAGAIGNKIRGLRDRPVHTMLGQLDTRTVKHITVGFYMTLGQMISMMIKFAFASLIAGIIIMIIMSILAPMFAVIVAGIIQSAIHSH